MSNNNLSQMFADSSIGVVLPTLNCATLLPRHLESMKPWLDLVSEIIVVDSHSDDGTVEIIRERLSHPRLRIFFHPRGLYQSWNFGLSQLRTKYAYISTVGDSITRSGLEHLYSVAERFQCDVVASEPFFITNEGKPLPKAKWPIADVLRTLRTSEPIFMDGMKLFVFVLLYASGGAAILGSSASNLYRTKLLQDRPFPTDFGATGDGAWSVSNVFGYRLGVTPEQFSTFRHHLKACSRKERTDDNIDWELFHLAEKALRRRLAEDVELRREIERIGYADYTSLVGKLPEWNHRLKKLRKGKKLWVFNPSAWYARAVRDHFRRQVNERRRAILRNIEVHEYFFEVV